MPLRDARLLVVDDEIDLAENLEEILGEEGARVRVVGTGEAALGAARDGFDVALVDVRLPDITGLDLVPRLREVAGQPSEVLLITGNASLEDAIAAVKAGAYAYVLKPFDPDDLVANVSRAVVTVRLEREARALAAALQQREESLRTLVDTVQALLLVLDDHGRVVLVNPAVAAATGRSREALIGIDWMNELVPKSDVAEVRQAFQRLVDGEQNVAHENRIIREQFGHTSARWIRWQASSIVLEDGSRRIYASGLDVTQVRELEQRTRIAEKLAAVGTLSAGLAHEIRNPLNSAGLQLQLLQRRLAKAGTLQPVAEIITTVQGEIDRLSRLVHEFLSFARPTELNTETVDFGMVVEHVVALERPGAQARGVSLTAEIDPAVLIEGDRNKLQQVVLNLLRNAVEAVGHGGHVDVRLDKRARHANLVVRDDGPGISNDDLARIFEPFFTTKEGGTGLGMSICHSLVSLHGGTISARSAGGAEFQVVIPLHRAVID